MVSLMELFIISPHHLNPSIRSDPCGSTSAYPLIMLAIKQKAPFVDCELTESEDFSIIVSVVGIHMSFNTPVWDKPHYGDQNIQSHGEIDRKIRDQDSSRIEK